MMSALLLLKSAFALLAGAGANAAKFIDALIPERTREKLFRYGMAAFAGWVLCYAHYDVTGLRAAAANWDHAEQSIFAAKDAELARYKPLKLMRQPPTPRTPTAIQRARRLPPHSCKRSPMKPMIVSVLAALLCAPILTACGHSPDPAPQIKTVFLAPVLPAMACAREPLPPPEDATTLFIVTYMEQVRLAGADCRDKADAGERERQRLATDSQSAIGAMDRN